MKRIIIVLVICFLIPYNVYANKQKIEEIRIVMDEPVVGLKPDDNAKIYSLPVGAVNKQNVAISWLESDNNITFTKMENSVFEDNKYYQFILEDEVLNDEFIKDIGTLHYLNGKIFDPLASIMPSDRVLNNAKDILPPVIICMTFVIGTSVILIYFKKKQIT